MNRTLTAAVALTAALGMAGLAHAQSSTSPSASPSTMNPPPATTAPSTAPAGTQNPAMGTTGSSTGDYGTQAPQANMNQTQTNQTQTNQASMPAPRSEVREAQQTLKSQGLYMGPIDGVMGPKTQTAVIAFQREHSLPETAQLDQQTLNALNSNGSSSGSSPTSSSQPSGAAGMTPGSSGSMNQGAPSGSGNYNR
jgi:hypothetical protein